MSNPTVCAQQCQSRCCRYITVCILPPTNRDDHEFILWQVGHEGVEICVNKDGDWFVRMATPCSYLTEESLCAIYDERPTICREYGEAIPCDEYPTDISAVRVWRSREEYLAYMVEVGMARAAK